MFVDVLCRFFGKSTVWPPVVRGWWNDSAWLFLSHIQECVRCHFGSAKQCWISAQTRTLAVGTDEDLMRETWGRGCGSSHWQKGKALMRCSLCLHPPPGTPVLHLCWAQWNWFLLASRGQGGCLFYSEVMGKMKPPCCSLPWRPHCCQGTEPCRV